MSGLAISPSPPVHMTDYMSLGWLAVLDQYKHQLKRDTVKHLFLHIKVVSHRLKLLQLSRVHTGFWKQGHGHPTAAGLRVQRN